MGSKLAARLAVLIDAENMQPAFVRAIIGESTKYGTSLVRRAYADWTMPHMSRWKQPLLAHSIKGIQQFAFTPGKNAADSAMIIDAIDLLHTKQLDGFCLVSSDSDFTPLAMRIRESGLMVYGFGHLHTARPFVDACDRFTFVESFRDDKQLEAPKVSSAVVTPSETYPSLENLTYKRRVEKILRDAVNASADKEGWAAANVVRMLLNKQDPRFLKRQLARCTLKQKLKKTGFFDIEDRPRISGGKSIMVAYVRDKHFGRSQDAAPQASSTVNPPPSQPGPDTFSVLSDPQLGKILRGAVEAVANKEGWAEIGLVKRYIKLKNQNLAARWFRGDRKIGRILERSGLFDIDRRAMPCARDKGFRPLMDAAVVPGEQPEASEAIPAVTTPSQEHTSSVVLERNSAMEKTLRRALAAFSDEEGWASWADVAALAEWTEPDLYPDSHMLRDFATNSDLFDLEYRQFQSGRRVNNIFLSEKRAGRSMDTVAYDGERPAASQASPIATAPPQEHASSNMALESNARPETSAQLDVEGDAQTEEEVNARPESDIRLGKETNDQLKTRMSVNLEKETAAELESTLRIAIGASRPGEDGWCDLVKVHDRVSKHRPGFSARRLGYSSFLDLVDALGSFETRQTVEKEKRCIYVRVRRQGEGEGGGDES